MKLAQILHILQNEPLLCDNAYRQTLLDLFIDHATMERAEFKHKRTGMARSGSELEVEEAEVHDGIAVIPVGGPVAINLGEFEKGAGAVDMDDVAAEISEAEDNDEVNAIILNFDSPGGTVQGTWELYDRIIEVDKPIYAFTRGQMCSAAYALGCACDGIFATQSGTVGNIGVYTTFKDLSQQASKLGIGVKVFSSGPIKGIGIPGTSLSLEQEVFMQERVMQMAKIFKDNVRNRRSGISDDDMGGQYYSGDKAGERGFVDGIVRNLAELEAHLRA